MDKPQKGKTNRKEERKDGKCSWGQIYIETTKNRNHSSVKKNEKRKGEM